MAQADEYVIVWEFRVRQAREAEFVEKYGPEGEWARFFRGALGDMSTGYIRTELVRDVAVDFRYLTLDYWQSEEEFKRFRKQNLAEYERLDKEFEGLTESERRLGAFWFGNTSN
jgi:heme-degrading monooxygenase HmoA